MLFRVPAVLAICAAFSHACSYQPGLDFQGNDLPNYPHGAPTTTTESCCDLCTQTAGCNAWSFHPGKCYGAGDQTDQTGGCCFLKTSDADSRPSKTSTSGAVTPSPSPPVSGKPNIVFLLTDDQDLRLGSLDAMPFLREQVQPTGANASNYFVHTPICCPSRSTFMTGKYVHNIKVHSHTAKGGCMRMNSSRTINPDFWQKSFIRRLNGEYGYTTGVFGKLLNIMDDYGCSGKEHAANGIDRQVVMCNPDFYNTRWTNFTTTASGTVTGQLEHTGSAAEDYTTSIVGNSSIDWIRSVVESGTDHPPFFAYIGPHAPHLPSTPPPYHVDPSIAQIPVPKDAIYGTLSTDKHDFLAREPTINDADAAAIQTEHTHRLQSLVAVDVIVQELVEYLKSKGEWNRTFFFYSSDHGYNLGQFRVDSHKTMVYDHNLRVPMIITGPGVKAGMQLSAVTSMVDFAPTILSLAGANQSALAEMDGVSFASALLSTPGTVTKTAALVEYLSIRESDTLRECSGEASAEEMREYQSAYGYHGVDPTTGSPMLCRAREPGEQHHYHDGPNNTFAALRVVDGSTDLLYAEFADVTNPLAWDFAPDQLNFHELYNVTEDYFMSHNIYGSASQDLKDTLHKRLQTALKCKGAAECGTNLT